MFCDNNHVTYSILSAETSKATSSLFKVVGRLIKFGLLKKLQSGLVVVRQLISGEELVKIVILLIYSKIKMFFNKIYPIIGGGYNLEIAQDYVSGDLYTKEVSYYEGVQNIGRKKLDLEKLEKEALEDKPNQKTRIFELEAIKEIKRKYFSVVAS